MRYEPRNVRDSCVCGDLREDIARRVWKVHDELDNYAHHCYYYRCPECHSFSSVNIYFPTNAYIGIPLEAFCIPEIKRELNSLRVDWISSRVTLREDALFCDLGSGEGCFPDQFTKKLPRARAIAVEADSRLRQKFYGSYERVEFVEAYIEDFLCDLGKNLQADLIAITDVLEHVVDPEKVLQLIVDALKPGGFVYLTVPNSRTYGTYPHLVAPADVDWDRANAARQHLWMLEPKIIFELVSRYFDIIEMSRTFETNIRQDSDYSTILAQTGSRSGSLPHVEQVQKAATSEH
jgi:2-polyprenyl-3-methyl-5-hydroxy-6-metoxy-1,4-benzoquinol methylase